ncbi:MerR family DNA-binding protein [Streptomyces sp. NBC_01481]|uniref:MerR family DNA-binding protein n=1 Tax=Streptomyces sp. NBC_01481 TaxID=2975869 RepID=UPI002259847E|nr:MerR family DNA-binding protein [Streptomyces sp. NBC_01481]MCX4581524.1 MerR family DNA-binding protein [Streptomyces sp. NBC_01481]
MEAGFEDGGGLGFRLYTEADVGLMVIRRMKPLGFTLDQMRDLLDATDRLDGEQLTPDEREALLKRVREYEQGTAEQVAKLRVQLARAEEFARTLRERVQRSRGATV